MTSSDDDKHCLMQVFQTPLPTTAFFLTTHMGIFPLQFIALKYVNYTHDNIFKLKKVNFEIYIADRKATTCI